MKKTILTLAISVASLNLFNAQITDTSIEGVHFSKYPAKVENSKAKLNLASHSLGKTYKTAISQQYKSEPINFGGHYVMTFWGAGAGMTDGAMVDAKTGKIIPLPLTVDNAIRDCVYNDNENIFHKKNSNLLVTFKCQRVGNYNESTNTQKVKLTFYYYKWDGKKFNLITTKTKNAIED
ncbi:MAG: hypothetical protein ACK4HC_10850 [Cloacibacterium sp.]